MNGSPEFVRLMAQMQKTINGLKKLKAELVPRRSSHWHDHHHYSKTICDGKFLDAVGQVCDQKLKEKGNFILYQRGFHDPAIKIKRRHFAKLRKIIKMEHELCGEEDW